MKFLYAAGNESKTVTVTQKRTLYIAESDITLTSVGEESALTLTNTESRNVTWSSSNTDVATVNAGKVRAVANGTAVITVRSSDGKYSDKVNVLPGTDFDFEPEFYAIALPKGNTELANKINTAIQELKADGTYDNLVKEYIEE